MKIGYARVGTREQNLDMQTIALEMQDARKYMKKLSVALKQKTHIRKLIKTITPRRYIDSLEIRLLGSIS
jgi:hypothetical protein